MHEELEMARGFYGFGRWDARYWFIGPEPGKGPKQVSNAHLAKAWKALGACELCDCKEYHLAHGEESWHREEPEKALLQPTWKSLLVLLMAFLDEPTNSDARRTYQRDLWGRQQGETCVIELCGLAARSFGESIDRETFHPERLERIHQKLSLHKPKLVVFYGLREKEQWKQLAGVNLSPDIPVQIDGTAFVMTPHPNDRGRSNADWEEVGKALRKMCGNP
jgi:hypothetical protein